MNKHIDIVSGVTRYPNERLNEFTGTIEEWIHRDNLQAIADEIKENGQRYITKRKTEEKGYKVDETVFKTELAIVSLEAYKVIMALGGDEFIESVKDMDTDKIKLYVTSCIEAIKKQSNTIMLEDFR